jgi:hypothetical protein
MSENYSKSETDSKLDTVEERINNSLNRMIAEIREGFLKIDKRFELVDQRVDKGFELVDKDIAWLSKLTLGVFFLLLGILVPVAIRWVTHWSMR